MWRLVHPMGAPPITPFGSASSSWKNGKLANWPRSLGHHSFLKMDDNEGWKRRRIPVVDEEEDGFECDSICVTLIAHDPQPLIEVMIESFDDHGVMVGIADVVAVDLKEIQCLAANTGELVVFI